MLYRNAKKGESLKYQPGVKSMKAPYIIVSDIESLLRKMGTCANDWIINRKKKMNMKCVDIHCLLTVYSIKKIINWIITEVKIL